MRKTVLLAVLAFATAASTISADAANSTASSGGSGMGAKMKDGAKAVGRGIMWGPKKVGAGLKKVGSKFKKSK